MDPKSPTTAPSSEHPTVSVEPAEDRPLVSFILLAYNQERFIREAVEGAFSQTYSPLEILLSDDCSTDRTFEIMKEMAAQYKGPHKIILNRNEKNLGICGHVNRAVELTKGELMVMAAGDDVSLPERVSSLISSKLWMMPESLAAFSDAVIINEKNEILSNSYFDRNKMRCEQGNPYKCTRWDGRVQWTFDKYPFNDDVVLSYCSGIIGATAAYKRDIFRVFGKIIGGNGSEDEITWYRVQLTGHCYFVPKQLVYYRYHDSSVVPDELERIDKSKYDYKVLQFCRIRELNKINDLNTAYRNCYIDNKMYNKQKLDAKKNLYKIEMQISHYEGKVFNFICNLLKLVVNSTKEGIGWWLYMYHRAIYEKLMCLKYSLTKYDIFNLTKRNNK